jgi:hypothetical protein
MVIRLKEVRFAGKNWFIDMRLKEYRNVDNPHDRISFDDVKVITCLK